jgi:hypothetical protein
MYYTAYIPLERCVSTMYYTAYIPLERCVSTMYYTAHIPYIKNTKFEKDLPMIDAQFRFNQCNSFREENISVFSHIVLC